MNIVWAALIIAATTAVAVAAMLAARRRAPAGSYFADGDRAGGIFGVVATGFSVLLGFLIPRAVLIIDQQLEVIGGDVTVPCDAEGNEV